MDYYLLKYLPLISIIVVICVVSISGNASFGAPPAKAPSLAFYNRPGMVVNMDGNSFNITIPYVYLLESGIPFVGLWNQSSWKMTENGKLNRTYFSSVEFTPRIDLILTELKLMYTNDGGFPEGLNSTILIGTNISFNQPLYNIIMKYNSYLQNLLVNLSPNLSNPILQNLSGQFNSHGHNIYQILQKLSFNGLIYANITQTDTDFSTSTGISSSSTNIQINSTDSLKVSFSINFATQTEGNSTLFMFQSSFIHGGFNERKIERGDKPVDRGNKIMTGYGVNLSSDFPVLYLWGSQFTANKNNFNLLSYLSVNGKNVDTVYSFALPNGTRTFYEDPYLVFPNGNIKNDLTVTNIGTTAISLILNNFEYFAGGIFMGLLFIGGGYSYYRSRRK